MHFFVMLFILCFASLAESTIIEGVVVTENGPLQKSEIQAYRRLADIQGGIPAFRSTPGDKPGFYTLDLEPGTYYVTATGRDDSTTYFSFHGANPISITGEKLWLPHAVLPLTAPLQKPAETTRLTGVVTYHGRPVQNAQVSLYPAEDEQIKGLGRMTGTTDTEGRFSMELPEGDYRLVARSREGKSKGMPLKKGDLFCYLSANPVTLLSRQETTVTIPCYPKDDIQGFQTEGAPVKRTHSELARFRESPDSRHSPLSLSGRVIDLHGNPLPGMTVMAFQGKQGQLFRMDILRLKSDFMAVTDNSGRFSLPLKDKGYYFLMAREHTGSSPLKGELFGLYEENVDHAVSVTTSVSAIQLTAGRIMSEQRLTPSRDTRTRHQQKAPLNRLKDAVIKEDTVWRGTIEITGRVLVARNATLQIAPGTIVSFVRVDGDGDGVGDGELRVLGRISAQGTPEEPIIFRSNEKIPSAGDWSYILLFTSGDENSFSHCTIQHAFSGLQAHFSRARIEDSRLAQNTEGIRFGRAEMTISHNEIEQNRHGIRYHRMEGPVIIEYNRISLNENGIFFIPSGQNRVGFLPEEYTADPLAQMTPILRHNAILNNSSYNFRHGYRQRYDSPATDNWWGSSDKELIRQKILDHAQDSELGTVILEPYLTSLPPEAGRRK